MLGSPEARRLLTVPGVNVIAAATFLAAVGDIRRFRDSRKLIAYLGLDPRVRQSGDQPARPGRISKRGSSSARSALVEAAWSVVGQPGPLRASYLRIKSRRGHGKAIVATARNHLTRIFEKLDVHSRAALASLIGREAAARTAGPSGQTSQDRLAAP
jgi:transposase